MRCLPVFIFAFALAGLNSPPQAKAVSDVIIDSPTTGWTTIRYGNNNPDDPNDQQTGSSEGDIVGNLLHGSAYMAFGDAGTPSLTDGTFAFRVRLGADTNPPGFKTALFIGIDGNADGVLDLFLGINNSGQADTIGIWSPGTGLNISPSTTTIGNTPLRSYTETATNYSWMAVNTTNDPSVGTDTDLDGGGRNDYFLSFSIAFSDVVAEMGAAGISGFNQNSPISFVIATSTQGNSLNQDLNGVGANFDPNATWSTLGVVSGLVTSTGTPIPEPSVSLLLMIALGGLVGHRGRGFVRKLMR